MTPGERIIAALKARLETITETAGYPLTLVQVKSDVSEITFNISEAECPLIEIIPGDENYTPKAGGNMDIMAKYYLRLVAAQGQDNAYMERFKAAVIRCLYGASFNATGNSGCALKDGQGNTIVFLRVTRCVPDLNMVKSNRIYALEVEVNSNRQTWAF